nr:DUF1428 domain-containing protein [Polymorphobacter glacialis]
MPYVEGFLIPVPAGGRDAYLEAARIAAPIFRELGALSVVEAWGDDIADGKVTDFRRAVLAEPGEAVVFSWITWPDKPTRDAGKAAMMADERMKSAGMPFDGKRMIVGGFQAILDTGHDPSS